MVNILKFKNICDTGKIENWDILGWIIGMLDWNMECVVGEIRR